MNKKNKSNSMDEYINVYKKIRIKNKNSRYIFRKNILEKKENFIKKKLFIFIIQKKIVHIITVI